MFLVEIIQLEGPCLLEYAEGTAKVDIGTRKAYQQGTDIGKYLGGPLAVPHVKFDFIIPSHGGGKSSPE